MRLSALCISGLVAGAFGACTLKPCTGKCISAITKDPEVGEAFCSQYLSLEEPATTTSATPVSTIVYYRREEPSVDPAAAILSQCSSASSRISSACSCFLSKTTSATSESTATATLTASEPDTTTSTKDAESTESATPTETVVIPDQPIVNGGFEDWATTKTLEPWTDTSGTTGGTIQGVTVLSGEICTRDGTCFESKSILRAFPPKTGNSYVAAVQDVVARPSTTYAVSLLFRCLVFELVHGLDVYYNGVLLGGGRCSEYSFFEKLEGVEFTTDETGVGKLEIRFLNPNGARSLYYYADNIEAKVVR